MSTPPASERHENNSMEVDARRAIADRQVDVIDHPLAAGLVSGEASTEGDRVAGR